VGGHEFVAYWEKVEGVCNFVIEWDGVEIARYVKCGYGVTVTCRDPAGEDLDTGDGLLSYGPAEILQLPHHEETTKICQTLDIAFVIDDTGSMGSAIAALKTSIASIVGLAEAQSDSVQFALLTFKDSVTEELAFSVGNSAAMISAINAVTTSGGVDLPEASDIALAQAVAMAGWRYPSGRPSRRIIILVTDAPPGGTDDINDAADELNLIQAAEDAESTSIILAAVSAGPLSAPSLRNAANANGEKGRYIPSVADMVDRIQALVKAECPDPAPCKTPFCGSCTCTNRKVCVSIRYDDCTEAEIFDSNTTDGCRVPEWDIVLDCGLFNYSETVRLQRNATTGACEIVVPVAGESDIVVTVSDCDPIRATWSIVDDGKTYEFILVSSTCGECNACGSYCCDERPGVVYMHIIPTSIAGNSGGGVEPDCLECTCEPMYNFPMNLHDECALISDEEAGWRIGDRFDELGLEHVFGCLDTVIGDSGIQLMCSGEGASKTYNLKGFGSGLTINEAVVVPETCDPFPSLYFTSVGSYVYGACNNNSVTYDISITKLQLGSAPTVSIGCP
jgi:Mg-chelatase subunit ChlD